MAILIRKKPNTPPIDCDAVDERIRNGAMSSISYQEHQAIWRRDQIKKKELISRDTAAAMLGVTARTLLRWHDKNFGPKREEVSQGRYGYRKAKVEAWVAEHGRGSHRPRSVSKSSEFNPGGQHA